MTMAAAADPMEVRDRPNAAASRQLNIPAAKPLVPASSAGGRS